MLVSSPGSPTLRMVPTDTTLRGDQPCLPWVACTWGCSRSGHAVEHLLRLQGISLSPDTFLAISIPTFGGLSFWRLSEVGEGDVEGGEAR